MLITRATPDDFARHFREKSIVSLFKETGFKTYWITNQFDYGNITIHAQEADEYIPLSTMYTATKNIHRDMELTGLLNNILQKKEQKVFVVIHTLGSHYDYDARYPDSYSRFQPTAKEVNANPTDASKKVPLTNSYDNSILYTDAVLDSVITIVSKQNAVSSISYTSDHGEELFDDSRNLSQHGFPVPSRYVAHVPWFIWTSGRFAEIFPQKVQNLNANRNLPLGSANVFYTLADLGNIKFYGDDESKSVANDEVSPQRQKILGGNGRVYDAETLAGETAQK
jgi:glucan phosphoethanolaminetransferase (alkaline phosphatase superfamily)